MPCASKEADLASLTRICHVELLYIDAALMLDASTRVAAAARSCLIDLHMHCVDDNALESKNGDNNVLRKQGS